MEWRLGDSLGISVTDETLERATRVKRLIGRPQESAQPERKSAPHFAEEPYLNRIDTIVFQHYKNRVGMNPTRFHKLLLS
ncbi:hypothetical protein ACPCXF_15525 [Lysinibacillus agricola]